MNLAGHSRRAGRRALDEQWKAHQRWKDEKRGKGAREPACESRREEEERNHRGNWRNTWAQS